MNITITQTQTRSAMEKNVCKVCNGKRCEQNNKMENIVKQLEKDNKELHYNLETSMKQKNYKLQSRIINKAHKVSSEDLKDKSYQSSDKDNITRPFDDLKCFLGRKEFRNTTLLGIHDRRFHLEKGRNLYKCDNFDDKFGDLKVLGQHIKENNIAYSMCKK